MNNDKLIDATIRRISGFSKVLDAIIKGKAELETAPWYAEMRSNYTESTSTYGWQQGLDLTAPTEEEEPIEEPVEPREKKAEAKPEIHKPGTSSSSMMKDKWNGPK